MGAFGTAFTLATQINVLPITIYNEFTLLRQLRDGGVALHRAGDHHLGGARRGALAGRRGRGGGGMMAKRPPLLLAAARLRAHRLRVHDRAGRDVDPRRHHRQLLRGREERPHAALGGPGVGPLPRHHLSVDLDRARMPRLDARAGRSRRLCAGPRAEPLDALDRGAPHAADRGAGPRDRARADPRSMARGATSARAGSSSSWATCSSRCPSWCARCSR